MSESLKWGVKNKGPLNLYFFYVSAKQELSQKKTRADSSIDNTDFLPITDFFFTKKG